jgi:glutamate/tyrosine decarboxylase-like PLP-dependent enzyme
MSTRAAYLVMSEERDPHEYSPEFSRRARGIEVWAALRSLGRQGLAEMIQRSCRCAALFADGLRKAGYSVLNDVKLNQVLVSFGSPEATRRVIQLVQEEGTAWCGGTTWQGHTAMRISVSNWATSEQDVERCLEVIIRLARQAGE